ncbi:hypothetical protein B7494_g4941 [Chlorociboria aeruginascens]|nr:hypothetical protein B7494_g4941 [Chlorociboria aeruginascens]
MPSAKRKRTSKKQGGPPEKKYKPFFPVTRSAPVRKAKSRGCSRNIVYDEDSDSSSSSDESVVFLYSSFLPGLAVPAKPTVKLAEEVPAIDGPAGVLFKLLPIELHQKISSYLPDDRHVSIYSRVCHKTCIAISTSVWRERFVKEFDMVEGATVDDLAKKYAFRSKMSKTWCLFDLPKHQDKRIINCIKQNQKWWLEMLKGLIIDSNATKVQDENGRQIVQGKNLEYIRKLLSRDPPGRDYEYTDILEAVLNTENNWNMESLVTARSEGSLVLIIQLCLTSLSLDPQSCNTKVSHFDLSQAEVYTCPNDQPIFMGAGKQDLNVRWLLHVVNFFKFHFKAAKGEGILSHAYRDLAPEEVPQPWIGKLKEGTQQLGSHWKGAYAYLDPEDLKSLRDKDGGVYTDEMDGLQNLTFFFDETKFSKGDWPAPWDGIVQINPLPESEIYDGRRRSTRAYRANIIEEIPIEEDVKHFYGTSDGLNAAHMYGRLHAVPPQQGIPGFQRVSIMNFHPDEHGHYNPEDVWAYEGCVLPGNRVIVGRWWNAKGSTDRESQGGPFIWWNVENGAGNSTDGKDTLEFLNSVFDYALMGH